MFGSQMRFGWMVVAGVLGLSLLNIRGCWRLHRGKTAAHTAESNVQTCHELAAKISRLRKQQGISNLNSPQQQVLADSLAGALSHAGLTENVVSRLEQLPPRPVANSSGQYLTAEIDLSGIPLSSLVSVTRSLITSAADWHATSIDLRPATSAGGDFDQTWDTTLTLTRVLIAP